MLNVFEQLNAAAERAETRRHGAMIADAERRTASNRQFLAQDDGLAAHRATAVDVLDQARDIGGHHVFDNYQTVELVRAFEELLDAKIALALGRPVKEPHEIHAKVETEPGPHWMDAVGKVI